MSLYVTGETGVAEGTYWFGAHWACLQRLPWCPSEKYYQAELTASEFRDLYKTIGGHVKERCRSCNGDGTMRGTCEHGKTNTHYYCGHKDTGNNWYTSIHE